MRGRVLGLCLLALVVGQPSVVAQEPITDGGEPGVAEVVTEPRPGEGQLSFWIPVLAGVAVLSLLGTLANTLFLLRLRNSVRLLEEPASPGEAPESEETPSREVSVSAEPAAAGPERQPAGRSPARAAAALAPEEARRARPGEPARSLPADRSTYREAQRATVGPKAPAPASDEFAGLPHGAIGRQLRRLHREVPALADAFIEARHRERLLAQLDLPLAARIERFKQAATRGEAYLADHWIEQDLVITLDSLSQFLSTASEMVHEGRGESTGLRNALLEWLYERLGPACKQEGWFAIDRIEPYATAFDPKIHNSIGTVALEVQSPVVVSIRSIGRRDPQRNFVTSKAEVVVGR